MLILFMLAIWQLNGMCTNCKWREADYFRSEPPRSDDLALAELVERTCHAYSYFGDYRDRAGKGIVDLRLICAYCASRFPSLFFLLFVMFNATEDAVSARPF
jgi:hypothetical protein